MDILKVLSRGTKPIPKKPGSANVSIPSAGNRPNPQLFHDAVAEPRAGKRKREIQDEPPKDVAEEDLSDVDFFAPKDHSKPVHPTKPRITKAPRKAPAPRGPE